MLDVGCRTYSVPEAAKVLGVGLHAVYGAVRDRRLPALRLRRKLRIPAAAVEAVLADPARFAPPSESRETKEGEG